MSTLRPNIPLLRKAVEWVEEQDKLPEEHSQWHQNYYRIPAATLQRDCGTCMCVAGKVCDDAGVEWLGASIIVLVGTQITNADVKAAELLGLTPDQAAELFQGQNTAVDVRRIAEKIAGERL